MPGKLNRHGMQARPSGQQLRPRSHSRLLLASQKIARLGFLSHRFTLAGMLPRSTNDRVQVLKIERAQNKQQWRAYAQRRWEIANDGNNGNPNEQFLKHGLPALYRIRGSCLKSVPHLRQCCLFADTYFLTAK